MASKEDKPRGLGRVQRIHRSSSPERARVSVEEPQITNRREENWEREKSSDPVFSRSIAVSLVLLTLGVLVVCVILWVAPRMKLREASSAPSGGIVPEKAVASNEPAAEEVLALVKKAVAVADVAEVPKFFRLQGESPERALEFLTAKGRADSYQMVSIARNGERLSGVWVGFQQGEVVNRYLALPVREGNEWKVDFAAFARKMDGSWDALLSGEQPGLKARVSLSADNYYNGVFADERRWACYRIESPDLDESLYGYCMVGSEQAKELDQPVEKRCILELAKPAESGRRQVEITRVLARDWIENP
ncbi:MAG: hypothetical protein QM680_03545 [Luteolibacter sp.]